MEFNKLGNSELYVSQICLGTMTFGNPIDKNSSLNLVHWVIDHDINFIDTADIYEGYDRTLGSPGGVSEKILGEALVGKREKIILCTKVGNPVGGQYNGSGLGRKHIEHQVNDSLKRLRTDYIDIYEMHKPDPYTTIEESINVFSDLIISGKIRHWGISNFDTALINQILHSCRKNGWPEPIVCQAPYSWLNREVEKTLLPFCESNNISVTPYRILEGGLLTGKYKSGIPGKENSRMKEHPAWMRQMDKKTFTILEDFKNEARENGFTPTQYAAKWLLDKTSVTSVLIGAKSPEQIAPFLV